MSRGLVAELRDLVPLRPLTREEALRIAELQANRLLGAYGLGQAPVPEKIIADLPRVEILRQSPWPVAGAAQWVAGRWLIVLNGDDSPTRQRFSLGHELKHIIDHRFIDLIYREVPEASRQRWVEQVCDYFAACLLMPRAWVKRSYGSGIQDIVTLAAQFDVSPVAMRVRLGQIGLTAPQVRCAPPTRKQVLELLGDGYRRSLPVLTT